MQAENTIKNTDDTVVSILFILDSSGSMQALGSEPIQSMRSFYNTQKETGKKFLSTFITFSDNVKFVHKNITENDIDIKDEDYTPNGMTALYDAIGTGIDYQKNIKTDNVICVILTDGHENSSKIYKAADIKKMTKEMEMTHKWVFIYLGANQDSFAVSESLGLNPHYSANYEYNKEGLSSLMRGVSNTVSRAVSHNVTVEDFVPEINTNFVAPLPDIDINTTFVNLPSAPQTLTRTYSS